MLCIIKRSRFSIGWTASLFSSLCFSLLVRSPPLDGVRTNNKCDLLLFTLKRIPYKNITLSLCLSVCARVCVSVNIHAPFVQPHSLVVVMVSMAAGHSSSQHLGTFHNSVDVDHHGPGLAPLTPASPCEAGKESLVAF